MKREFRAKPRRQIRYNAWLQTTPDLTIIPCRLSDMSEGGVRVQIDGAEAIPVEVNLLLAQKAEGRPCRVVWRSQTELGLRFDIPATIHNTRRKL